MNNRLTILQTKTFCGKEKKGLAYIIGIMNMILHGIETPNIVQTNPLNDDHLKEFVEFQESFKDSEKSWFLDLREPEEILKEIAKLDKESAGILVSIGAIFDPP